MYLTSFYNIYFYIFFEFLLIYLNKFQLAYSQHNYISLIFLSYRIRFFHLLLRTFLTQNVKNMVVLNFLKVGK